MDHLIVNRLSNFFWIISCLLFLVALSYIYAFLPPTVSVFTDKEGIPEFFLSSSQFFFIAMSIFIFTNLLLYVLKELIINERANVLNFFKNGLIVPFASWLISFAMVLNIFFIASMAFISIYNNATNLNIKDYTLLVYIGPVLIGAWLLGLLFFVIIPHFKQKTQQVSSGLADDKYY